jgi:class 3 adenylate cyclase/tetratricopeptide (TPR) repeat protein
VTIPPRERRIATILFSDLSGFTRLSQHLDPEDVADTVDALFHRLRAAIESHGGTVDKFIGDAVMAVFGAPTARGDDATRAARASLALLAEVASFNSERGTSLAIRVGINTGEVLWGSIGGEARPTAMGDAVNLAQRIEAAAAPGTVLVSASTRNAAGGIAFDARGEIEVKGRDGRIPVFEARDRLPEGTELAVRETPLVGRESDVAELLTALRRGARIWLCGEPGVGKTRLAAETRTRFRRESDRAWVAAGRASDGTSLPLEPFAAMVWETARLPRTAGGAALVAALGGGRDAVRIARSIGGHLEEECEAAPGADESRAAWERWLAACAADRPALVVVEDAHAADPSTLSLLGHLAARLPQVAFLATARPGGAPPAGFEVRPVPEIGEDASRRLAESVLGGRASDALLSFLRVHAGGHPLYLEELARFLRDGRLLRGSPLEPPPGEVALPAGLHGLLLARLDAAPCGTRETLKAASVLGREFWPSVVSRLLGSAASPALADAQSRGLIAPRSNSLLPGEEAWAFRHALLRDAAYALLPKKDRARLHAEASADLEARAPEAGRRLLALSAAQRAAAGEPAAASRLWMEAELAASAEYAYEEAAGWARAGWEAAPGPTTAYRAARALYNMALYPEALRIALDAVRSGDAAAWHVLGNIRRALGDLDGASRDLQAALQASSGGVRRSRIMIDIATVLWRSDRPEEALQWTHRAETELAGTPSPNAQDQGAVLETRALVFLRMGKPEPAIPLLQEALMIYRRIGARPAIASGLTNIAVANCRSGNYRDAIPYLEEAVSLWRATGDRQGLSCALNSLASAAGRCEQPERARELLLEALPLARSSGDQIMEIRILANLALAHSCCGSVQAALDALAEAIALARLRKAVAEIPGYHEIGAAILAAAGRDDEAVAHLHEALRLRRESGDADALARVRGGFMESCAGIVAPDGPPQALRLLDRLS